MKIRKNLARLLGLLILAALPVCLFAAKDAKDAKNKKTGKKAAPAALLYESPNCASCERWNQYMKKNGFDFKVIQTPDMQAIKAKYKIPQDVQSYHTAIINGFFFEGHIPAEIIQKFLKKPPQGAIGLAVPGAPIGSPGMEQSTFIEPYNVYSIRADGNISVYAKNLRRINVFDNP